MTDPVQPLSPEERAIYADGAKHHPVPWECPEHGEASLHGGKKGLTCGLCRQLNGLAALVEAQAEKIAELTDLEARHIADKLLGFERYEAAKARVAELEAALAETRRERDAWHTAFQHAELRSGSS